MSRQAASRKDHRVAYSRRFQLLSYDVALRADSAHLGAHLDYLVQGAVADWPRTKAIEIDVRARSEGEGHQIFYDGQPQRTHIEPAEIVYQIFADLYRRIGDEFQDHVNLHAASLVFRGKRVLALGASGSGKTTLAMAALGREGWNVEGDDRVFLKDGHAMACPRRFHIKKEGLAAFPQLASELEKLPQLIGDGRPIYAFDPSEWGHEWHIGRGPVAGVVHLEPFSQENAGSACLEPCAKVDMVRILSHHASPLGSGRQDWLRELSGLADQARCYRLWRGDIVDSLLAIETVFQ